MNSKPVIIRLLAFIMLALFTLGITPKRYLHHLFVAHTDVVMSPAAGEHTQVSASGYHCDCEKMDATSPFIDEPENNVVICRPDYPAFFVSLTNELHRFPHSFIELRGPPAVG